MNAAFKKATKCAKALADQGCFHRGHGGRRARKVRRTKKAIETKTRQAGRRECAG